jgi:type IV secretory pathway TraG/TraD family ATPase VirD4
MFFSPRDWTTSDYISRMTGMTGVPQASKSFSQQKMNLSLSTRERRSMLPEDVRELSENEMLVSLDYAPGFFRAGRRPYYVPDSEFAGRWDRDPYHFNA